MNLIHVRFPHRTILTLVFTSDGLEHIPTSYSQDVLMVEMQDHMLSTEAMVTLFEIVVSQDKERMVRFSR